VESETGCDWSVRVVMIGRAAASCSACTVAATRPRIRRSWPGLRSPAFHDDRCCAARRHEPVHCHRRRIAGCATRAPKRLSVSRGDRPLSLPGGPRSGAAARNRAHASNSRTGLGAASAGTANCLDAASLRHITGRDFYAPLTRRLNFDVPGAQPLVSAAPPNRIKFYGIWMSRGSVYFSTPAEQRTIIRQWRPYSASGACRHDWPNYDFMFYLYGGENRPSVPRSSGQ
jgi:hypothetical protein